MTFTRLQRPDFDPFAIGFDRLFERLSTIDTGSNYPPYNIIKHDENSYVIEVAVAGFAEDELEVEVHDGILTISGSSKMDENSPTYVHRGIARRDFVRKFTLADTVEVVAAQVINGMLQVRLDNHIPEHKKPRKIPLSYEEPKQFLSEEKEKAVS